MTVKELIEVLQYSIHTSGDRHVNVTLVSGNDNDLSAYLSVPLDSISFEKEQVVIYGRLPIVEGGNE